MPTAFAILVICLASEPAAAEYQVGDTVVVVKIAPLKVDDRVVDRITPGFSLDVLQVEDRRLWVECRHAGWLDSANVIPLGKAAAHFTNVIRLDPLVADHWQSRAKVHLASHDFDAAIADLDEAIHLVPTWRGFYGDRGIAHLGKRDFDRAISDFSRVLELAPDNSLGYDYRGVAQARKGEYAPAMADFEEAHRLVPDDGTPLRHLAELLACCPDEKLRDGDRALRYSTKACRLSKWRHAQGLHCLACAHAETGNHAEASRWQHKAIAMTPADKKHDRAILQAALARFESGQPYHEIAEFEWSPVAD